VSDKLITKTGAPTKAGVRARLNKAFLQDLLARWEESGPQALKILALESPLDLVRVVANCLPREDVLQVGLLQNMSEEELEAVEARIVELQSLSD